MNDWIHVTGTSRPQEIQKTLTGKMYIRKNITAVDDISPYTSEENHTPIPGYEYDEILLMPEEYERIVQMKQEDELKKILEGADSTVSTL